MCRIFRAQWLLILTTLFCFTTPAHGASNPVPGACIESTGFGDPLSRDETALYEAIRTSWEPSETDTVLTINSLSNFKGFLAGEASVAFSDDTEIKVFHRLFAYFTSPTRLVTESRPKEPAYHAYEAKIRSNDHLLYLFALVIIGHKHTETLSASLGYNVRERLLGILLHINDFERTEERFRCLAATLLRFFPYNNMIPRIILGLALEEDFSSGMATAAQIALRSIVQEEPVECVVKVCEKDPATGGYCPDPVERPFINDPANEALQGVIEAVLESRKAHEASTRPGGGSSAGPPSDEPGVETLPSHDRLRKTATKVLIDIAKQQPKLVVETLRVHISFYATREGTVTEEANDPHCVHELTLAIEAVILALQKEDFKFLLEIEEQLRGSSLYSAFTSALSKETFDNCLRPCSPAPLLLPPSSAGCPARTEADG